MLKAIETVYRGYRFRSRLEARWAVFYDRLGVRWQYEKEGYDLGKTGYYLPDFWLPDLNCWIEVKGERSDEADEKCAALATASEKMVYMCVGDVWLPDESGNQESAYVWYPATPQDCWCDQPMDNWFVADDGSLKDPPATHTHLEGGGDNSQWWCECGTCHKVGLQYTGRSERLCDCLGYEGGFATPRLMAAYEAARAARFDHEERERPASKWRPSKYGNGGFWHHVADGKGVSVFFDEDYDGAWKWVFDGQFSETFDTAQDAMWDAEQSLDLD